MSAVSRKRLFDLIDATPHLDWLLLTKRPERVRFDIHHGIPSFPITVKLSDKGADLPEDLRVREFPTPEVTA